MKKVLTLCVVYQGGNILLGMKKRGFGQGWWNGFGGKLHEGETVEAAAIRECQEEAGIIPITFSRRAMLTFYYPDELIHEVHVFLVDSFSGTPQETEEMKPQWFARADIPYDKMWADDPYWLSRVLDGECLQGEFWFDADKKLLRYTVDTVSTYA